MNTDKFKSVVLLLRAVTSLVKMSAAVPSISLYRNRKVAAWYTSCNQDTDTL